MRLATSPPAYMDSSTSLFAKADQREGDGSTARQLIRELLAPEKYQLASVFLLSLASSLIGLLQPLLTKELIDTGVMASDFPAVVRLSFMMLGIALFSAAISYMARKAYLGISSRITNALRETAYKNLLKMPPSYFHGLRTGDAVSRLISDIAEIQRYAIESLLGTANGLITLTLSIGVLWILSPQLCLVVVVVITLNFAVLSFLRPSIERLTRSSRQLSSDLSSYLVEALGGVKCIQAHNAQDREIERLKSLHQLLFSNAQRVQDTTYLATTIPSLALSIGAISIFLWGSYMLSSSQSSITLGVLIAFVTYMQRAASPIQSLMGLYVATKRVRVSFSRIDSLLQTDRQLTDAPPNLVEPRRIAGRLELRNVSFSHRESRDHVLRNVSANIPAGSRVLLCGPSGSGKSTLLDLIHRHFDPDEGAILLDDTDLRHIPLSEIRRAVCIVSQEVTLFSGSISNNICYGVPTATEAEIRQASRMAGASDFIERLPDGYLYKVVDRGHNLSGGERQRISLARAVLMNPAILIVDEAVTGVEMELRAKINREIDKVFGEITRIYVTHEAIAANGFDYILTVRDGTIHVDSRRQYK